MRNFVLEGVVASNARWISAGAAGGVRETPTPVQMRVSAVAVSGPITGISPVVGPI